jgi:hypothetical protein
MTNIDRIGRRRSTVILLLTLVIVGATKLNAEVGVVRPISPAPALQIYQLAGIGDDPDPIHPIWRVYGQSPQRAVLNPTGEANGDGPPSLMASPSSGLAAAAWSRNSASGFDVVVSRFDGTSWTEPQVVAGAPDVNELDPQLVAAPDGSVHLFYWSDGPSPQVFYTSTPAGMATWSAPIPVSPPGQLTCRPAGVFFGGVLRVVYEVHEFGFGNSPRQVVIARYESGTFITEIVATTNYLGEVRPQVHAHGGKLWVDWIDAETSEGSGELAWTRLNPEGYWELIEYQPYYGHTEREYFVRGAARTLAIQP